MRAAVARMLEARGDKVVQARDGHEGWEYLEGGGCASVIVLDLLMPRLTGFDVLRDMRQDERVKDTIVLAISSVYKDNILDFLHQLGAQGFLDKAQIPEALLFRVQSLLAPGPATA